MTKIELKQVLNMFNISPPSYDFYYPHIRIHYGHFFLLMKLKIYILSMWSWFQFPLILSFLTKKETISVATVHQYYCSNPRTRARRRACVQGNIFHVADSVSRTCDACICLIATYSWVHNQIRSQHSPVSSQFTITVTTGKLEQKGRLMI